MSQKKISSITLSDTLTHFFLPIDFFRDPAHRISYLKPQIRKRSDINPSCGKIHELTSAFIVSENPTPGHIP